MADQMAVKIGVQSKPMSQLSTIEKLNLQAEKEVEIENTKKSRRSTYETIVSKRDGRIIGKPSRK